MHKSVLREAFTWPTDVRHDGMVLVAREVEHPSRGRMLSPAADLLTARLRARGCRVDVDDVIAAPVAEPTTTARCAEGVPDAVLRVDSYLDRDGAATGLGALFSTDDPTVVRIVTAELDAWTAAMRTRRIVTTATRPECGGVVRSLSMLDEMLASASGHVYVYGRLTDNPVLLDRLRSSRVIGVDVLDEVPDGATVLFAQHGVPLAVAAEAAARGLSVVDATCPLVTAAHAEVRRFADRGETVILAARPGHAAVPGLLGQAPESVSALDVGHAPAATALSGSGGRVAVVVQPGLPEEDVATALAMARARFGRVVPQHPSTLCHAAEDRRAAVRGLAGSCDALVVTCSHGDPDVEWIEAAGRAAKRNVYQVTNLADLRPEWIAQCATLGVTATTRADPELAAQVVSALTGLGPAAVVERRVETRPVGAHSAHSAHSARSSAHSVRLPDGSEEGLGTFEHRASGAVASKGA